MTFPPFLHSVSPQKAPLAGGTYLEIKGRNLGEDEDDLNEVSIFDRPCDDLKWINSSFITCTSPPGEKPGLGKLYVQTKSGNWSENYLDFYYNFVPLIQDFFPRSGPLHGNTLINITGSYFGELSSDLAGIWINKVPCLTLNWSSINILCKTQAPDPPIAQSGLISIKTYSGGTGYSNTTSSKKKFFTFNHLPFIDQILPDSSPATQSTEVEIYGKYLGKSLGDIKEITLAGILCKNITYLNSFKIKCQVEPIRNYPENSSKIHGPVLIETFSGGSNNEFNSKVDVHFTFYFPPKLLFVYPLEVTNTRSMRINIGGLNLGLNASDVVDVTLAGVSCRPIQYSTDHFIFCDSPIIDQQKQGPVIVTTKSGGMSSALTNVLFSFSPDCSIFRSQNQCSNSSCFFCKATTTCVKSPDDCPALCLHHANKRDCIKENCHWCHSISVCLDRAQDCPPSCFLYRSEKDCSELSMPSERCEWCSSTSSCLSIPNDQKLLDNISCPRNCSLVLGQRFSCGSLIILILLLLMIVVIIAGFAVLIHYLNRDERLASDLKNYTKKINPSGFLHKKEKEKSTIDSNLTLNDTTTLLPKKLVKRRSVNSGSFAEDHLPKEKLKKSKNSYFSFIKKNSRPQSPLLQNDSYYQGKWKGEEEPSTLFSFLQK